MKNQGMDEGLWRVREWMKDEKIDEESGNGWRVREFMKDEKIDEESGNEWRLRK